MDELKFHFRQLVPVIFTLSDGEKHVAAASVNVVDSSTEKLNTASARGLAMRHDVGFGVYETEGCWRKARGLSQWSGTCSDLKGAVASEKRFIETTTFLFGKGAEWPHKKLHG